MVEMHLFFFFFLIPVKGNEREQGKIHTALLLAGVRATQCYRVSFVLFCFLMA